MNKHTTNYSNRKLLHEEVYMPQWVTQAVLQMQRVTTKYIISEHWLKEHAGERFDTKHNTKDEDLLYIMKNTATKPIEPFEVELTKIKGKWKVTKYVIRVDFTRDSDLAIVIRGNKIITCWLNDVNDLHYTLDKSKYETKLD